MTESEANVVEDQRSISGVVVAQTLASSVTPLQGSDSSLRDEGKFLFSSSLSLGVHFN